MIRGVAYALLLSAGIGIQEGRAQGEVPPSMPPLSERVTIAGGMAVSYIAAGDIVNLVNATPGAVEQAGTYKTGIQFFGSVAFPLSRLWSIKADYAYLLASYSIASDFGGAGSAEYTISAHLPSIVFDYTLVDRPEYAFRAGFGAGYHIGQLSETFYSESQTYSAEGIGILVEAEGMTAVSENIFAVIGVNARWEWIGALKNSLGVEPTNITNAITLNMFAPSVKIGVVYAF